MTETEEPPINIYEEIGRDIGCLVDKKQKQYGDSFGKSGYILNILYPNGVPVDQYTNLLTLTRVIDKLFRVATNHPSDEESPWKDIAGYALLALELREGYKDAQPKT